MLGRVAIGICLLPAALAAGPASVAPLPEAFLAASFMANPIPADGAASSTLRIDVVRLDGAVADGIVVTVERDPASAAVCSLAGLGRAEAVVSDGHAEISVTSSDAPGQCRITATAPGAVGGEATLTTKAGGTPTRLTVSGNDSPRMVGAPVTLAIDIDDVYVNLVANDETSIVNVALDRATCTGAPGGPASIAAVDGGLVTNGRAWFIVRSDGAYGACRVTFTASGLRSAVGAVTIVSGPADHLTCQFTSSSIAPSEVSALSVELRDIAGNSVANSVPYTIALSGPDGAKTAVLTDGARPMRMGAVFFFVRAGAEAGIDVYTASVSPNSVNSLRDPQATCTVEVRLSVP